MTRVYSRFSGCDTVGCSANGKQHMCPQLSNGEALVTSAWGIWGRWNGCQYGYHNYRHKSISTPYSSSKQQGKY